MPESENQNQATTFITLQLDTGETEFRDLEELETWVAEEVSFFAWMENGAKKDGNSAHVWNATNQWLTFIAQFIQQYRQHQANPNQQQIIIQTLHNQLSQVDTKGHLITSQNPDAIFGKNLSGAEDEVVACYALNNLLGMSSNQNSPKALLGAFLAFQYKQGSETTVESQVESLETLKKNWNSRFNERHLELRGQNESLIKEIEQLRDQFDTLKSDVQTQKDNQVSEFDNIIDNSKDTLSDIALTYDEKLALQASVQYWMDKRKNHTTVMWWVGGGTLVLAILTGGGFVYAAHKLLQVTIANVELWRLGVMLAISTFGIWMTRLAAKIFISNLHLRTDADERVTMIQTYLALLREGSGPKEGERQLILQTLFRRSTTGFIKDDGPASFHDILKGVASRK